MPGQPTRVLAWRIPGTEEPDGLPSMGSHRVGHDWSDLAAAAAAAYARHCVPSYESKIITDFLSFFYPKQEPVLPQFLRVSSVPPYLRDQIYHEIHMTHSMALAGP